MISRLQKIALAFGITNYLYYTFNSSYNAYFKTEAKWSLSLMIFFIVVYAVSAVVIIRQDKNPHEYCWYQFVS